MLERFHLADVAGRRPHEVSGGQKQRCSIARALIGDPSVLLLDEPARGLDAPLRAELYAVLRQVRADFGIPILLVTHDLDECFELGDEMLVLRDGRMVQSGAPAQGRSISRPASDVARLLGMFNLSRRRSWRSTRPQHQPPAAGGASNCTGPTFPGHLRGDRVWLCVRAGTARWRAATASPAPIRCPCS